MIKNLMKLIMIFLFSITLISCKSNISQNNENNTPNVDIENQNINEEENEEQNEQEDEVKPEEKFTEFEALGKIYTSSKDLSTISEGADICDDRASLPYTPSEYKELDFAKDVLYLYLNEDDSVYDYLVSYSSTNEQGYIPITEDDNNKLKKDFVSLRTQMELPSGNEMVVRLDKVTYEGIDTKTNSGAKFKIRVAISRVGATLVPWNYFTITVFEEGNKLKAYLF